MSCLLFCDDSERAKVWFSHESVHHLIRRLYHIRLERPNVIDKQPGIVHVLYNRQAEAKLSIASTYLDKDDGVVE